MKKKILLMALACVTALQFPTSVKAFEKRYDAREDHIVTPVKDQDWSGLCWSFALCSSAETSMIKNKVKVNGKMATDKTIDLSEAALGYYYYNREVEADPLKGSVGDRNIIEDKNLFYTSQGGYPESAALFLSTWMGVKEESYFPLDLAICTDLLKKKHAYKENAAVVRNIAYINEETEDIKKAIKKYGSVVISMSYKEKYFNEKTAAYCNPKDSGQPHAVSVIGWDDSYSYKNFPKSSKVKKNGAWIVKNSYGTEWGDEGYFYMSYEEQSINRITAIEMQSSSNYRNNYFYDGNASMSCELGGSGTEIANEFIARANPKGEELLKATSFVVDSENVDYSVQVYKNLKDKSNPTSGKAALAKPIKGRTTTRGLYTVDLGTEVRLQPGERFSIVITLKDKDGSGVSFGVESSSSLSGVEMRAVSQKNTSFVRWSGTKTWRDLSVPWGETARIKAYTNNGKQVNYQIVYDANGGKGVMRSQSAAYGETHKLSKAAVTRKGYSFLGWNTKKNGTGVWYSNKQKVKNLTNKSNGKVTLYAQWSKNPSIASVKSNRKNSVTVKWKKTDASQTGYQIRLRGKTGTKKVTVKGAKNATKVISGLKRKQTYEVTIRTYRKVGKNTYYGTYSKAVSVKI